MSQTGKLTPEVRADRDRRDRRRDHVDPRHDDRQRRAADAARDLGAPLSTIQWVSTGYLLALATVIPLTGWAAERFGPKRVWMTAVAAFVVTSAPVRPGLERRVADRLPRAPGLRRRHDHADRDDHAGPGGGPAAHGPDDERRRRADAAGAGARPGDRRPARRQPSLALDLLREPPDRHRRAGARRAAAAVRAGARAAAGSAPVLDWPRAADALARRGARSSSASASTAQHGALDRPERLGAARSSARCSSSRSSATRWRVRLPARRRPAVAQRAASRRRPRRCSWSAPRCSARCSCCRSTTRSPAAIPAAGRPAARAAGPRRGDRR